MNSDRIYNIVVCIMTAALIGYGLTFIPVNKPDEPVLDADMSSSSQIYKDFESSHVDESSQEGNQEELIEVPTDTEPESDMSENQPEIEISEVALYVVKKNTSLKTHDDADVAEVYEGEYYTGYTDGSIKNKVIIHYNGSEALIDRKSVKKISSTVLPLSAISQLDGYYFGSSACGPTSVSMIMNAAFNEIWDKDDLITFVTENELNDCGDLCSEYGGMTSPMLIDLVKLYSDGKYKAKNVYNDESAPSDIIMHEIDKGNLCLISVQYSSGDITSNEHDLTHFIVVNGYEKTDSDLYFYYADSIFSGTGDSLKRVSSEELNSSINAVVNEPQTIIVIAKKN